MLDEKINKKWKLEYFTTFAQYFDDVSKIEQIDKLKVENFPPVIAKFYDAMDTDGIKKLLDSKLVVSKAKLDECYNEDLVKIGFEKAIKAQLNALMHEQIAKLNGEDPTFLSDEELEIINSSDFPFIKLMTLVYSKDTDQMTTEDQEQWKNQMNHFISEQILFYVINIYFTMKLYQDNLYTATFQTPYNREHTWSKYANNHAGLCLTYDFKEFKDENIEVFKKLYPVIFSMDKLASEDFDFDIYNSHCLVLNKVDNNVDVDYDHEWKYILHHKYTKDEYEKLNTLLEPLYARVVGNEAFKSFNDYLVVVDGVLEYDYKNNIKDVYNVLESDDFKAQIADIWDELLNVTPDSLEVDFLKPEAIYLGSNYPEDAKDEVKQLAEDNQVKIFQVKSKDDKYYKVLV